jgi:hypothetical protein
MNILAACLTPVVVAFVVFTNSRVEALTFGGKIELLTSRMRVRVIRTVPRLAALSNTDAK